MQIYTCWKNWECSQIHDKIDRKYVFQTKDLEYSKLKVFF